MENQITIKLPGVKLSEKDKVTPGTRMRCAFEVTAGLFPGNVIAEYTRRWVITGECWQEESRMTDAEFAAAQPDGKSTFMRYRDEAHEYAKLISDPRLVNYVKLEWVWA